MGLDMYLYKRSYVQNWGHTPKEEEHEITVKVGGKIHADIKPERIAYIIEQITHWRKFNALHGWIVENCAAGVDDCSEIYLSTEHIKNLLEILEKVKEIILKSEKTIKVFEDYKGRKYEETSYDCSGEMDAIFPPRSGFFFGSLEIDNYFLQDVEKSIKVFQDCLKDKSGRSQYFYQASW